MQFMWLTLAAIALAGFTLAQSKSKSKLGLEILRKLSNTENVPGSTECFPTTSNAYSGRRARTFSGETCQRWDTQIPHRHVQTDPSNFPDPTLSDAANFCRDPDGEKSPWCYTMNSDKRWEFCSIDQCIFEFQHERCYNNTLTAKDYNGPWNRTGSGKVCQRWDAQSPHRHSLTSSTRYPDNTITDAENYCRDPDYSGYTWCYTMEPGTRWEACDVTSCAKYLNDKKCYETESHSQYTGSWDMTVNYIKCQRWDAQTPHKHSRNDPANFPDDTVKDAGNYCRDPDNTGNLWCYTMDPSIRWLHCGMLKCSTECFPTTSKAYSGRQARTASGVTCQRWDTQIPHKHSKNDLSTFPDLTLSDAANFCRDPNGEKSPWCYTMNPDIRWEFCSIDQCNFEFQHERCNNNTLTAKDYNGPWNRSRSGKVCQRWDAQSPHRHSFTSSSGYPDNTISDAENYCRDPSDSGYTWCYTMETGTRWEACDVTSCAKYLNDKKCYETESHSQYTGSWDMTVNYIKCQRWDAQTPHNHSRNDPANFPDDTVKDAGNYCRDPDNTGNLWCYTMDPSIRLLHCGMLKCSTECFPTTSNAYSGRRARTASGETCQRWDTQIPHKHSRTNPSNMPDPTLSDAANFCRDPDGERSPWCYTMNPAIRWEFCSIDQCNFEFQHERCYNNTLTVKDYNGQWNRSRSGKVCQRWDAQSPHKHSLTYSSRYPDKTITDAENYCRDPDNSGFTWCYTMEAGTRWEACDVTSCAKYLYDKKCYETVSHSQYNGSWDMTINYIKCQRWDAQTPHKHSQTDPANFPDDAVKDAGNYCRDPDNTGNLWCYTMDPSIRWLFCGILKCPANHVTCYDSPSIGKYMGTWNKTESGKVCQRWDSQLPHSHRLTADMFEEVTLTDAENFCRDPNKSGELWCYTTDPETHKEKCGITKCS